MYNLFEGTAFTREIVRKRDNYTCQKCGKVWDGIERRFDVHHLNGICGKKSKSYDRLSDIKGLITLCHRCHLNLPEVKKKMFLSYSRNSKIKFRRMSSIYKDRGLAWFKKNHFELYNRCA